METTNNGSTWDVLFDDQDDVVSIGDVTIAPDDANLVWVGTGENNNRQSGSWGKGVYKSTDGGQTWTNMGLRDSKHISRIIVDPIDHDVVYVAALGSVWGPGKERGVFKTTDGGVTWTNVLFVDADTGATRGSTPPARRGRTRCSAGSWRRWWWWRWGRRATAERALVDRRRERPAHRVHSPPTAQQMRGLTAGRADLARVVGDTNALISRLPALYDQIGAGQLKPAAMRPIGALTSTQ